MDESPFAGVLRSHAVRTPGSALRSPARHAAHERGPAGAVPVTTWTTVERVDLDDLRVERLAVQPAGAAPSSALRTGCSVKNHVIIEPTRFTVIPAGAAAASSAVASSRRV